MALTNLINSLEENAIVIADKAAEVTHNSLGTKIYLLELVDGTKVGVHQDSIDVLTAEVNDSGKLPSDWRISQSGMLYKHIPRDTSKKAWEI